MPTSVVRRIESAERHLERALGSIAPGLELLFIRQNQPNREVVTFACRNRSPPGTSATGKRGRSNMGLFTPRDRAPLDAPAEPRLPGKVRELPRTDFAPRRRPVNDDMAGHIASLMQRTSAASLREIDDLIVALRRRRE